MLLKLLMETFFIRGVNQRVGISQSHEKSLLDRFKLPFNS